MPARGLAGNSAARVVAASSPKQISHGRSRSEAGRPRIGSDWPVHACATGPEDRPTTACARSVTPLDDESPDRPDIGRMSVGAGPARAPDRSDLFAVIIHLGRALSFTSWALIQIPTPVVASCLCGVLSMSNEFTKLAVRYPVGYALANGMLVVVLCVVVFRVPAVVGVAVGTLFAVVTWAVWRPGGLARRTRADVGDGSVKWKEILKFVVPTVLLILLQVLVYSLVRRNR